MTFDRDDLEAMEHRLLAAVRGVHERLDLLNGRTRQVETSVAVLHDRSERDSARAASWGAGAGAAIAGTIVGIYKLMSAGQ